MFIKRCICKSYACDAKFNAKAQSRKEKFVYFVNSAFRRFGETHTRIFSGGVFEVFIKRIQFKNLCKYSCLSNDIFLRIFAFDYLPKTVEKVLYLDADAVFLNDVRKIYDTNLDGKLMACVKDIGYRGVAEYFNSLNLDHPYFNAGMLLMNLKEMRTRWNADEILKYVEENNSKFQFQDQDVLNTLCKAKDLVFLEKNCNYQVWKRSWVINFKKIVFLHYLSRPKPWDTLHLNRKEKYFWKDWEREDLFHKKTLK